MADETKRDPQPFSPDMPAPEPADDEGATMRPEKLARPDEREKPGKREKKEEKRERKEKEKEREREKQQEEEPRREGRLARLRFSKKKDMPGGLWLKCESCAQVIFRKELEEKGRVCPSCGFHFTVPGAERVQMTVDEGSWRESFPDLEGMDRLRFQDAQPYGDKLRKAAERTGKKEALILGTGAILGHPVVLAVLDFGFMGGSMGEVVGEKVALGCELAARESRPLVIFTSSGGARKHEGVLSLMQMAKTCAALQTLNESDGFSVCVMTHPTTGGVTASFASVTDLILAEPGALIGFAGPRVIATTLRQELPSGFQRAEFLLEKGMIDAIVPRAQIRETLAKLLGYSHGARVSHGGGALRPKSRG